MRRALLFSLLLLLLGCPEHTPLPKPPMAECKDTLHRIDTWGYNAVTCEHREHAVSTEERQGIVYALCQCRRAP